MKGKIRILFSFSAGEGYIIRNDHGWICGQTGTSDRRSNTGFCLRFVHAVQKKLEIAVMSKFIPGTTCIFCRDWRKYPSAGIVVFCGRKILFREETEETKEPDRAEGGKNVCTVFPRVSELPEHWFRRNNAENNTGNDAALRIGELNGEPCFCLELDALPELPPGLQCGDMRLVLTRMRAGSFYAGCRAKELLFWRRQHRYCGACGALLEESGSDAALVCTDCGTRYYPQLAPAVIVAVIRGDQILLAHNRKFQSGVHGLIAGFVEAGENAEQAVTREVMEETGIRVGNIRYLSSQSWPYPNSLMLAFTAEYVSGELCPDGTELDSAGWFRVDALPELPPPGSIARRLIELFRRTGFRKEDA